MLYDEAHELSIFRINRADDVLSNVSSVAALSRAAAAFDPVLTGAWVAFISCFVSIK